MKIILNLIAVILSLAGAVFFLQGINILPGSFMTGDPQWAVIGALLVIAGAGLFFWAARK
jgi:hypothetical protein